MDEIRSTGSNKIVCETIEKNFGGKSAMFSILAEDMQTSIDMIAAENGPQETINSYATIGLSDLSIGLILGGIPLGIELVGACQREFQKFPNIIAAMAFDIIHSKFRFHPGAVFKNAIPPVYPDFDMKHILFVPPYGWDQEFLTLELPSKQVAWLMALPISEAEWKFYKETESGDLEELFEKKQIDMYDLKRTSVI